jgi:twitching motility protein PilT
VKCVDTILRLLLLSNGHAVLLRASQIPLMMTGTTQSPLPLEPLSTDQMAEIVTEIVPLSVRARLRDTGSVDYTVPRSADRSELSITAIGDGDDIWLEVRPQLAPEPEVAVPAIAEAAESQRAPEPVAVDRRRRITTCDDLNALIRRLASRSDSSLFLHSGMPPAAKTDGAVEWLDEFEPLDGDDLGRLLVELSAAITKEGGTEQQETLSWTIPDVALVQCRASLTSPAIQVTIRIKSTRPPDIDRLAIPAGVLAACRDDYGLVILAGTSSEYVGQTCHGVIGLINRECSHHVIVLERETVTRHPRGAAFLSQRVVTGDDEAWAAALSAALAEAPDVLVTEHVPSWETLDELLAHATETLVIVRIAAPSVLGALNTLLAFSPAGQEADARARVADVLAAAVAQCELRPRGAAAISAYEVMLATPAVRDLIRQGAFDQLALTLERGADGMVPMSVATEELGRAGARRTRLAAPATARLPREHARRQEATRDLSLVATATPLS